MDCYTYNLITTTSQYYIYNIQLASPNPKAPNMLVTVIVPDATYDSAKGVHVARNRNGSFLLEAILVFGFFQQLHEERMVEPCNRNYKSLLFTTCFTNFHSQTPFWHSLLTPVKQMHSGGDGCGAHFFSNSFFFVKSNLLRSQLLKLYNYKERTLQGLLNKPDSIH